MTADFEIIPKKLHLIWVGDDAKRPQKWIDTWRDKHPDWEFQLWDNSHFHEIKWQSHRQMRLFAEANQWCGVADLMRYEILCEHGGVYVDADSVCLRPLDDWLLHTRFFAIWESERRRPGMIANGFIGSVPQHPVLKDMVQIISKMNKPIKQWSWRHLRPMKILPWKSTGPRFFTKMLQPYLASQVTILPSILFLPKHFLDKEERVCGFGYARHNWGSTQNSYEII